MTKNRGKVNESIKELGRGYRMAKQRLQGQRLQDGWAEVTGWL